MAGFTRSAIIDTANKRTEFRGRSLNLASEYITALQEVCLERRWWWRKRIVPFTITAGNSSVSLPVLADTAGNLCDDFQQMAKDGFKIYNQSSSIGSLQSIMAGCQWNCPSPVFETDRQEAILALQNSYPPALPIEYFITGAGLLVMNPVPDNSYPASIAYWAIPQQSPDDEESNDVPLLPIPLHGLLIKRLEMHIERFSVGEETTKYKAVCAEYEELLEKAQLYTNFADGEVKELRSHDRFDAVQSS